MAQHESAHEDCEDRFYAQFDSRDVELMTLDELQEAFEAGRIHENTFVCREGESEWSTLAVIAGLGEDEEPEAAPVIETRPPMPARRPDVEVATATRPPLPARAPEPVAGETRPPMPPRRPEQEAVASTRPPMPARVPEPVAGESRPPMPPRRAEMQTVPAQRFQQVAESAPTVQPATGLSYAPVTSNIDLAALAADDELTLRPKRRWGWVAAAAGVLALAGGGTVFALNSSGGHALAAGAPDAAGSHSQAALSPSIVDSKPSEPAAAPTPVAPSAPEPVADATPAADASSDAPKATPAFSDDMKAALLAADKTRTAKKAKVNAAKASAAPRRGKAAATSGVFKSGGSAYDPLNGKL